MSGAPASPLSPLGVLGFVGPFGTGKTEIAINYSLASVAAGRDTALADLDVVTSYFRVGDYRGELEAKGVRVIAAPGALASFENPSLPPEITGALSDRGAHVVLDVGGDPSGARLLGAYAPHISAQPYDLWLVVNPFRPSSSSAEALRAQRELMEKGAGLHVSSVVANPHLGRDTEPAHIESGFRAVTRIADELGLPIAFLAMAEHLLERAPAVSAPVLVLRFVVRLPWEPETGTQSCPKNY